MPILLNILLSPVLLFISIPLSLFAALTTTLAFSTLMFRALLIYAELGAVLVNHFIGEHANENTVPPPKVSTTVAEGKQPRHKSRRSSTGSASNGGSTTPRVLDTGFSIYSAGGVRDFEGVGGVSNIFIELFPLLNLRLQVLRSFGS